MCGDSGIDSILITNSERAARQSQSGDLADRFSLPVTDEDQAQQDTIQTELMLCKVLRYLLVAGFGLWLWAMAGLIAHSNAIPSLKGINYANQGK